MFYKNSYDIEQYAYDIDIVKFRRILSSFRSGAHCLSIGQQQQYQLHVDEHECLCPYWDIFNENEMIYLPFI